MPWIKKKGYKNVILVGKGYTISYNPCPVDPPVIAILADFYGLRSRNGGTKETAIVIPEKTGGNTYKILDGDYRKEYEKCKTLKECLRIFEKNIKYKSKWSN